MQPLKGYSHVLTSGLGDGNKPAAGRGGVAALARLSLFISVGVPGTAERTCSAVFGAPVEVSGERGAGAAASPFYVASNPGLRTWEYPFKKSENLTVWQITEKNLFEWSRWLSPSFLENTGGTDGSILMSGSWMQDPCGSDEVNLDHSIADGSKTDIKILQPPDASLNTLDFFIFGDALLRLPVDPS